MRGLSVALVTLAAGCSLFFTPKQPKGHWDASARQLCVDKVCYRVGALPDAWRAVHQKSGAIGFYSDELGGVIESNVTCSDGAEAAPLTALTNQLLIGYSERQISSQTRFDLAQREALRSIVHAKLDGVPVRLELIVLKRNGCIFDLSFAAPPASWPRGEPDFERFVAGFAQTRGA